MVDSRLDEYLSVVGKRLRRVRFAWLLSGTWIAVAVVAYSFWSRPLLPLERYVAVFAVSFVAVIGFVLAWIASRRSYRDQRWLANYIEIKYPTLQQRLLTAVQIPAPERGRRRGFLHQRLIDDTLAHAKVNHWEQAISASWRWTAWICQYGTLALACIAVLGLTQSLMSISGAKGKSIVLEKFAGEILVEPGDTEIERGSNLVITARFGRDVPSQVWMETRVDQQTDRASMRRNLQDPVFGGYLMEVMQDTEYRVTYLDQQTKWFRARVFEYPSLVRSDLKIVPPSYTAQEARTVEDTRRATVVEGTEITWICTVNKPLESASLVDEQGKELRLVPDAADPTQLTAVATMMESTRWKLRLVDEAGRSSKIEEELHIRVLPNKPPEVKLARPADSQVSPLEEFQVAAHVEDDYAAQAMGISYTLGDASPVEMKLGEAAKKADVSYLIDLESLHAEPDQLLSYHFWAEDIDRDGQVRRVTSDLFFAEVRPFDEIFREGQAPPGGEQAQQSQMNSQAGQQAEQLGELQKQIIAATWNVLRSTTPKKDADTLVADIGQIKQSQTDALEQLDALAQEVQDPKAAEYVDAIRKSMEQAIEELDHAESEASRTELQPSLASEQSAYQGLLKLRAREHQVMRSQQQNQRSSQSGSAQARQQQLEQLELKDEENRYETEQKATPPEDAAQRETRQVMNRLRELARRQEDLNQQLKDLETALQAAKTEEEREKLEEQLKRLRDAQQDLLRDSDELLDRMNQPEARDQLEEARSQVEQARENVRQAAEALNQEQTAPALAAGTRAERQLEETREKLRQESANEFSDAMRQMSQEAKELDEKQQQLTQDLQGLQEEQRQTSEGLRSSDAATDFQKEIAGQEERLDDLLKDMQQTVDQAESSEPLLADKLYESYREAKQRGVTQQLDQARQLIERGLDEPAAQVSQRAGQALTELRKDVEQAAESVLGSEVDSLRRAASELERASNELEQEIERRDPSQSSARSGKQPNSKGEPSQDPNEQQRQSNTNQQPAENEKTVEKDQSAETAQPTEGQQPSEQSQPGGQSRNPKQSEEDQQDQTKGGSGSQPGERSGQEPTEDEQSQQAPSSGDDSSPNASTRSGNPNRSGDPSGGGRGGMERGGNRLDRLSQETRNVSPLTGDDFLRWSDTLRDIEELVDDPELQSRVAQVREAAREIRRDYTRHAKEPQWSMVRQLVAEPLQEIRKQVTQELLRQTAEKNAVVPIDRDPVPTRYERSLQDYYERLGGGR
jgi:hypothetical protein